MTVGNVYEPFLGACHRFDIFVDRLLDGYTVAEASWMSMPVLSWQGWCSETPCTVHTPA